MHIDVVDCLSHTLLMVKSTTTLGATLPGLIPYSFFVTRYRTCPRLSFFNLCLLTLLPPCTSVLALAGPADTFPLDESKPADGEDSQCAGDAFAVEESKLFEVVVLDL